MNLSELKPQICGIYKLCNIKTGKIYIGQSVDIESRWHQHVRDLTSGKHVNKKMLSDFQEFGLVSFEADIIEECDKSMLDDREAYWVYSQDESILYNGLSTFRKKLV